MNAGPTLSSPPARRQRPVRLEPFFFSVFLALLTLGINLSADHAALDSTAKPAQGAHVASAR